MIYRLTRGLTFTATSSSPSLLHRQQSRNLCIISFHTLPPSFLHTHTHPSSTPTPFTMRAEMGKEPSRAPPSQLNLPPGFRFYPTDEELVVHYLCKKAASEPFGVPIIAEVELYKFDPWDLPERALFGEKEWYFFSPRDRKYPNGSRPNRAAGAGYWKATGTDKPISTMGGSKKVGVKKALVFYKGKAPKGVKTNWIMHEYRLADSSARSAKRKGSLRLDDWVLCRIYKKCSSAQKAASAKERSESSCLDEVLATLPEIDDRLNPLNGLQEGAHTEKPAGLGFYQEATQYSGGNSSDLTTYMQQQQQLQSKVNMTAAMKIGYRKQEANDQGASSLDLSHPDSNGFSSRQHSPPDSMQEEDSVESTFNSLASFPLNTSTAFPQSFYGLDVGLPSPSTMLGPGAFGESDFLFSTSDYTANFHRAFSQPDRGSHVYWDSKVNFA